MVIVGCCGGLLVVVCVVCGCVVGCLLALVVGTALLLEAVVIVARAAHIYVVSDVGTNCAGRGFAIPSTNPMLAMTMKVMAVMNVSLQLAAVTRRNECGVCSDFVCK